MITSKLLNQFPQIRHGFGTRGTVYPAPRPWLLKQIHSDRWYDLDKQAVEPPSESIEGDAVITACAGRTIGVQTADCVPLLMVTPGKSFVAAVHAGWKGTAAGLPGKMVQVLREEKGIPASDIFVAIGPCIQLENYEVGEEVAEIFVGAAPRGRPQMMSSTGTHMGVPLRQKNNNKYLLDLPAANRQLLLDAGIPPENIDVIDLCTYEREDLFYSYRRDGAGTGRQISWIMLR